MSVGRCSGIRHPFRVHDEMMQRDTGPIALSQHDGVQDDAASTGSACVESDILQLACMHLMQQQQLSAAVQKWVHQE